MKYFLTRALDLAGEFGSQLINIKALKVSIEKGQYKKIDGAYFIEVDALAVFNVSCTNQGVINIDFYIH